MDQLRKAGATDELLRVIFPPPPPPPPPPPRPKVAGPLRVICAPPDCEVFVDNKSYGSTRNGTNAVIGLQPGSVSIAVKKEGYHGQEATKTLLAEVPSEQSFILNPTEVTKEKFGAELFSKMVDALGGDNGLRQISSVSGSGSAFLRDQSGQTTEWKLSAHFKLPDAYLKIEARAGSCWSSLKAGESKSDCSRKLKKTPIAIDMPRNVQLFRDYQLATLIRRVRVAKPRIMASSANRSGSEDLIIRVADGASAETITLGDDFLPIRIARDSGVGSRMEIFYSDYASFGKTRYPKKIAFQFAAETKPRVTLQFSAVIPDAGLTDKHFR